MSKPNRFYTMKAAKEVLGHSDFVLRDGIPLLNGDTPVSEECLAMIVAKEAELKAVPESPVIMQKEINKALLAFITDGTPIQSEILTAINK